MIKKILVVFSLVSFAAYGDTFRIAGNQIDFISEKVLVDREHCLKKPCVALQKLAQLNKVSRKELELKQTYKSSLGSLVCAHVFKGDSVFGKMKNGDMRAFCLFTDKSLMELNSLDEYLKSQKTIVTE